MHKYLIRPQDDVSNSSKRIKLDSESTVPSQSHSPSSFNMKVTTYKATEVCAYGEKCYRRNVHHFKEYRHPHLECLAEAMAADNNPDELPKDSTSQDNGLILDQLKQLKAAGFRPSQSTSQTLSSEVKSTNSSSPLGQNNEVSCNKSIKLDLKFNGSSVPEPRTARVSEIVDSGVKPNHAMTPREKWEASNPFNTFLTSIGPEKTFFSMSFPDLFHKSFGMIKRICHINFMVEIEWVMDQMIFSETSSIPTTIIYGTDNPDLVQATKAFDWINSYRMKSPHTYGHHHSKMTFIEYEDLSIRFVVYTANLIESDWMNKTQGMWISPACPPVQDKKDGKAGESPTNFRADMMNYLVTYQLKDLENWIKNIANSDCSEIKVVFVASAPVLSQSIGSNGFRWGIKKVEAVLKKHLTAPVNSQWPIIAQCSSIGSLGPDDSWLRNEWGALLDGPVKTKPIVKLVYPSYKDVVNSAQGEEGADCLPYANIVHSKQKWIEGIMCNWVGFRYNRTYALPHIKTYCRVSPDCKQMAWYILTSANLSKAAWGKLNKKQDNMIVMSWECGVMFLPKFFTEAATFDGEIKEIDNGSRASSRLATDRQTVGFPFPVPYDLPLTPYSGASKPWLVDYLNRPRRGRPS